MTQEQKQFIVKAIESGIPAIAQEHVRALEEVEKIVAATNDDLGDVTGFDILNQTIYETTVKTIVAAYPFMANELVQAYAADVNACNDKFVELVKMKESVAPKAEETPAEEVGEVNYAE